MVMISAEYEKKFGEVLGFVALLFSGILNNLSYMLTITVSQ
jgi:hypothetical protein